MWEELYETANLPLRDRRFNSNGLTLKVLTRLKQRYGEGTDFLKIGPIKVFADGGFTGPAAYTLEPYRNQGEYRGYLNMPPQG